jgi:hypothetical protein
VGKWANRENNCPYTTIMGRHFGIERTSNVQGSAYITARFVRRAQCPSGRLLRIASVGSQLVPKPGHATLIGNTVHAYYAVRLMDIAFGAATIPLWEADKAQCQACSLEKAAAAGVSVACFWGACAGVYGGAAAAEAAAAQSGCLALI